MPVRIPPTGRLTVTTPVARRCTRNQPRQCSPSPRESGHMEHGSPVPRHRSSARCRGVGPAGSARRRHRNRVLRSCHRNSDAEGVQPLPSGPRCTRAMRIPGCNEQFDLLRDSHAVQQETTLITRSVVIGHCVRTYCQVLLSSTTGACIRCSGGGRGPGVQRRDGADAAARATPLPVRHVARRRPSSSPSA